MGSICGDLRLLTRRQLYSKICELSREIDCLKNDLLRHKLLSNECQKYLHFLAQINDTNDTSIEYQFIKQINDLKDTQNCFILLNELPLNVLSNHFDDMFVSIGCQTSDESLEVLPQREDNTRHETQDRRRSAEESDNGSEGIECETEWISMDVTNDGSVDENQSKKDEIFEDKTREIEEKSHTISDTNVDINCQTICVKETQNSDSNASNDLQNATNNGSKSEDIMTDSLDTNCRPKRKKSQMKSIECKDNDNNTDEYSCGASSEDISDESDFNSKQRVKRVKTSEDNYKDRKKSYNSRQNLNKKRVKHLGKRFFCDYDKCCKHFSFKCNLMTHKKSGAHVLNESFTCCVKGCDYQTEDKEILVKHITSHSTDNLDTNCRPKKKKSQMKSIECEDNDSNTDEYSYGASDEDISDESDFNSKQRVKRVKTSEVNYKDRKKSYKSRQIYKQRSDGMFACDFIGCDKVLKSKSSLSSHKLIHSGDVYPCDVNGCSETFAVQRYLEKHKLHKHCNKYRCDVEGCGYSTGSIHLLNDHRITHSNDQQFKCLINNCSKRFKTEKLLNRHQFKVHPNERTDKPWIKCTHNDCDYKTKCTPNSTYHMRKHTKPYVCDECGKGFANNERFINHKRTHNESLKIQCEWYGCDRRFSIRSQMKDHMNTHTAETAYPCQWPGCDKTYLNIKSMQTHERRVHKGVKDLSCHWPECDYSTTNPIRLNNHINKQHEDLDDYKCSHPNCDFKTTKCGQMDRHMTTHSTKI